MTNALVARLMNRARILNHERLLDYVELLIEALERRRGMSTAEEALPLPSPPGERTRQPVGLEEAMATVNWISDAGLIEAMATVNWISDAGLIEVFGHVAPTGQCTLEQALTALRELQRDDDRERAEHGTLRLLHTRPAERLVAAAITARDYPASPCEDPRLITAVADPDRPGWVKAVFVLSMTAPDSANEKVEDE